MTRQLTGCAVRRLAAALGAAVALIAIAPLDAQPEFYPPPQSAGAAWFSLRPIRNVYVPPGIAFGIFGPTPTVELAAVLVNEDTQRLLVVEPGFFRAVDLALVTAAGAPVAVKAHWEESLECRGQAAAAGCVSTARIILGPEHSVHGRVTLTAIDGPIEPGAYRLSIDLRGARGRLREADLTPWQGGFTDRGSVGLQVLAVRTTEDRRAKHRVEAGRAMVDRDYEKALSEYRQWAASDPSSREALAGVGFALFKLGRFAEAVVVLERLPPPGPHSESLIHIELAIAYAALGQDDRAEAVVRRHVMPSDVADVLARIRARARELTGRAR